MKTWENKVIYGQYVRSTDRQFISEEDTLLWLSRGDLEAETESEILLAQEEALQAKCHAIKILQAGTDSKCRFCRHFDETVEHNTSACPMLAKEQYTEYIKIYKET
jgi:hypothetical protein